MHTIHRIVRQFLNEAFPNRWIGRGGAISWPARSPDLTPLDFFLWGFVKEKVYRLRPTTAGDMKLRIRDAFRLVNVHLISKKLRTPNISPCNVRGKYYKNRSQHLYLFEFKCRYAKACQIIIQKKAECLY
jgi:hypothetical protein